MNAPFTSPKDRAAEVSGPLPSAPADAAGGRTLERSPSDLRMDAAAARARHNTAVAVALEERAAEIEAAWEADDDPGLPSTDDRLRRSRANMAMLAELDEILRRTNRIVERFMPMRSPPSASTRYPELNAGYEAWVRYSDYATKRGALHRSVKARIAAKVRLRKGQADFARQMGGR